MLQTAVESSIDTLTAGNNDLKELMKAQASSTKERSIAGRESTVLKLIEIGSAAQEVVLDARETLEGGFSDAK